MDCTLHYTMYNYEVKLVNYYCCSNVVNVSQGQYWRLHLRNACDVTFQKMLTKPRDHTRNDIYAVVIPASLLYLYRKSCSYCNGDD